MRLILLTLKNAYNPKIQGDFENDIKTTIDIIHGKANVKAKAGHASGVYTKDVSQVCICLDFRNRVGS